MIKPRLYIPYRYKGRGFSTRCHPGLNTHPFCSVFRFKPVNAGSALFLAAGWPDVLLCKPCGGGLSQPTIPSLFANLQVLLLTHNAFFKYKTAF